MLTLRDPAFFSRPDARSGAAFSFAAFAGVTLAFFAPFLPSPASSDAAARLSMGMVLNPRWEAGETKVGRGLGRRAARLRARDAKTCVRDR